MASNGITAKQIFQRIWIAGKISLVKRAPGINIYNGHQFWDISDQNPWK